MATTDPQPVPILRSLPDQLLGDRVLLRPFRPGDGSASWEAVEETREQLRRWMPWVDGTRSASDSEVYARQAQAQWLLRDEALPLGVWERESDRFHGGSGLHRIDWNVPRFEIWYWLRASAQGQGLMTEAVTLLCRFAFETLAASRVEIRCDAQNEKSIALPQRLGFVHEATLRNECCDHHGQLRDTLVFAMTPDDYTQTLRK